MIDFQQARREAFEFLSQTNSVIIWGEKGRKNRKFDEFVEVWKVATEVFLPDNTASSLELLIALPSDFPISLPKIYISENDRNWIGFIPHVNANNFVCVFDEDNILTDPAQPGGIVSACIEKAKIIIEIGITRNVQIQFRDEFLAYWEEKNDDKDLVINGLSIISSSEVDFPLRIKFIYLNQPFGGYNFILHDENDEINNISSYLKISKREYSEHFAFYLGDSETLYPPYGISNAQIYQLVNQKYNHLLLEFEKYINKNDKQKVILLSIQIKGERILFGYYLPPLSTTRKGFRNISPLDDFTKYHKTDRVARFKFDEYTKRRLWMRTDGNIESNKSHNFTFVGLGSIGSNLLMNILALNINELNLIDPEFLTLENINRHTLGMDDVSNFKVDALKQKLESKDPLLKVNAYKESIIKVIQDQPEILNKSDIVFLAIGKTNIESFVCKALNNGIITKPLIIIWIEPYLYGGHCLYFTPGQTFNYLDLFERGRYKFNIVSKEEYESPSRELQLAEAGCQGSYIPYGKKDILLFMTKLVPVLFGLIETTPSNHIRMIWRGYEKNFVQPPLKLSDIGLTLDQGEIQTIPFS